MCYAPFSQLWLMLAVAHVLVLTKLRHQTHVIRVILAIVIAMVVLLGQQNVAPANRTLK